MRKLTLLFVVVFALCTGVLAQGTPVVPCGTLSEADCDILEASRAAAFTVTGADFTFAFNMDISNVPDLPGGAISFAIDGSGTYSGDMSGFAGMANDPAAMQAMMADPTAITQYFRDVLTSFDGTLNLTVSIPDALVQESNGQLPSTLPLNLVLVDGVGYLDFDTLAGVLPAEATQQGLPTGWWGIDFGALIDQLAPMMTGMMQQGGAGMGMPGMDAETMAAFQDPAFLNQFVTVTREADTTAADGTGVAVFTTTFDFAAMMNSPEMMALIEQSMSASMGSSSAQMTDEQRQQMMDMMTQIYQDIELIVTEEIGLEDNLVRGTDFTMSWDMTNMMTTMGESAEGGAPVINIGFTSDVTNYNAGQVITLPEGAQIVPNDMLTGAMGGGMGGSGMSDMNNMDPNMMATLNASGAMDPNMMATMQAGGMVDPNMMMPTTTP